jgi:hypothetical protein
MSSDTRTEQAILEEARTEVSYADHKASMVLAALGIGFGAVLGGLLAGDWSPSNLPGWGEVLWWTGAALATASVTSAATAVWPRYRPTRQEEPVAYWAHVARFSSYEELCRHLDRHPSPAADRTRRQMWEISLIVTKKYRYVRAAFVLAGSSILLFLLASAMTI